MRDEREADEPGDDARVELVVAERRRDVLDVHLLELHRQRAVVDELGEVGRPRPGEVARDQRRAAERRERVLVGLDGRRRLHEAVEHDRDLLVELLLGERVPLAAARAGEVHLDVQPCPETNSAFAERHRLAGEPGLAEVVARRVLAPGLVRAAPRTRRAVSPARVVVGMVGERGHRGVVARRDGGLRRCGARLGASSWWWSPRGVVVVVVVAAFACAASRRQLR